MSSGTPEGKALVKDEISDRPPASEHVNGRKLRNSVVQRRVKPSKRDVSTGDIMVVPDEMRSNSDQSPQPTKFKALILDLDGTTIPNELEGMPSPVVVASIEAAKEYVEVAVATGRPYHLCRQVLETLGITAPCVIDGGAQIIDVATGEILFERMLSVRTIREVIKLCLPFRYDILSSASKEPRIDSVDKASYRTQKLCLVGATKDDAVEILEALTAIEGIAAYPVAGRNRDRFDIHITHIQATKRHSIRKLLRMLDVKIGETIGVGDSNNDLPLFESSGLKVAMGNASEELKRQANYVAPSVAEDGVADVIARFIITP